MTLALFDTECFHGKPREAKTWEFADSKQDHYRREEGKGTIENSEATTSSSIYLCQPAVTTDTTSCLYLSLAHCTMTNYTAHAVNKFLP